MYTSLLARLLGAARTVNPLAPVNPGTLALTRLPLGQTVRAQVSARLADGSFRLVIDDAAIKLALPSGMKAGDVLTLRLVAREPHLEFDIDRPPGSAEPRLSGAARLIGRILSEPAMARPAQAGPVAASPILDAAKLNEPLARAIQRSGLFYEAHQARWLDGAYPLDLLQEEPQAALGRLLQARVRSFAGDEESDDANQSAARDPAAAGTQPEDRGRSRNPQHGNVTRPASGGLPDGRADPLSAVDGGSDPLGRAIESAHDNDPWQAKLARELLPIVRQQLEAIETRQIVWQGELWPGLPLRWQIADRAPDPQHSAAGREWLTRVALQLPALGEVNADLALGAHGVRVVVTARDAATADSLRAAAPELAQALEAAGLRIAALEVRHHER